MIEKIFSEGVDVSFLMEIVLRSLFMFIFILCLLRLSGRRGVRQLTLFEVAIILGLGSAAGDPMFQDDIPILYAVVVLGTVLLVYKLITWAASKFSGVHYIMEGRVKIIVREGRFDVAGERDRDFSKMEFFAELRNQSVEHLGQIKMALLEVDGSMSLLFYADDEVRDGLPLFPNQYKEIEHFGKGSGPYACMYCGVVVPELSHAKEKCCRCRKNRWTKSICTRRIS